MRLSAIDRKILNYIQEDIPLSPKPFKKIAGQLNMEEGDIIKRIKQLKDEGIIRSFAAGLNHRKLGFKSTLLGIKVSSDKLDSIVKEVTIYPEVTHCYLRKGEHNLWLVFLCKNGKMSRFINKLTSRVGKGNILNLTTKKQFKLRTRLKI